MRPSNQVVAQFAWFVSLRLDWQQTPAAVNYLSGLLLTEELRATLLISRLFLSQGSLLAEKVRENQAAFLFANATCHFDSVIQSGVIEKLK
jgi:hypothetical protein